MSPFPRTSAVVFAAAWLGGCVASDRVVVRPAPASGAGDIEVSRALTERPGAYHLEFTLHEGPRPAVRVAFEVAKSSFQSVDADWGYRESDLELIRKGHEAARMAALREAEAHRMSQEDLDSDLRVLEAAFIRAQEEYLKSRGFQILEGGRTRADLGALVRRHAERVAPLMRSLQRAAAAAGYPPGWAVPAATALVQTGLDYQPVPAIIDGFHIGGVFTPAASLVHGWGDCDSKGVLLAALLAAEPGLRVLGIEIEGHYLLAVSLPPGRGDSYLRYRGEKLTLIEAAGPGRLRPGRVSDEARRLFAKATPYTVEPLVLP